MKHRIVEHMSSSTADALGLSRAILCNGRWYFNNLSNLQDFINLRRWFLKSFGMVNYVCIILSDGLIKKLEELEQNATIYKGKLFVIFEV